VASGRKRHRVGIVGPEDRYAGPAAAAAGDDAPRNAHVREQPPAAARAGRAINL
jgi:hypothetical protein